MTTAEELALKISGDASGAQQALKSVQDSFSPLADRAKDLGDQLKNGLEDPMSALKSGASSLIEQLGPLDTGLLAVGGVAVAAGVLLGALSEKAIAVGEGFNDFAEKTAMTVEAASRLDFVAKVAGSSLDQMGSAIFMMQKRMADDTTGNFAAALGKIGLNVRDIESLAPDQQFIKIAEAFAENTTQSDRASVAMALFGKAGRDLVPLLMKDLGDLNAQAADLGHTMSGETAKGMESLAMGWRAFKESISWTGTEIGVETIGFFRTLNSLINQTVILLDPLGNDAEIAGRRLIGDLPKVKDIMSSLVIANGDLTMSEGEQKAVEKDLADQHKQLQEAMKKAADEAAKWQKLLTEIGTVTGTTQETLDRLGGTVVEGTKFYLEHGVAVEKIAKLYGITGEQVEAVRTSMKEAADDLAAQMKLIGESEKEAGEAGAAIGKQLAGMPLVLQSLAVQTGSVTLQSHGFVGAMGLMADESGVVKQKMFELRDSVGAFEVTVGEIPGIVAQALTGGGGLSGGLAAIGSSLGKNIGIDFMRSLEKSAIENTGESLSGIAGEMVKGIPVIGSLIGPLVTKLFSLGGPSGAELEGRKIEASFEQSFGGLQGLITAVGTAYEATGRSSAQAQADVKALMDAEKQGGPAVQAMIDKINGAFADQKAKAADVSDAVNGIVAAAKIVGTNFPPSMQPALNQLLTMNGLTDDEKKALQGLSDTGTPSFSDLTTAAGHYGLSLDDIGGKVAQLSISHEADQIAQDYQELVTTSGADSDKVLAGMKDSLNKLVQHAMDTGSVLPTTLEPLVKQLLNTGQLVDGNGDKITDLSKLKFDDTGDPLNKGMSSLTDALNRLGDILSPTSPTGLAAKAQSAAGAIGAALGSITAPSLPAPWANWGDMPDFSGAIPMAAGGDFMVTRPTLFLAGEAGPERATFSGAHRAGAGMGSVTIQVDASGSIFKDRQSMRELAAEIASYQMDRLSLTNRANRA